MEFFPTALLWIGFLRTVGFISLLAILFRLGAFGAEPPFSSNSVVRFHFFTGDGPLGDVDVELFASEKPQTV